MKKFFLIAMTLIICGSAIAQQKIQLRSVDKAECVKSDMTSLKASFSFSSIQAEDYSSDRGTFSWLSLPNTVLDGNVGEPQIPVVNELIAVPFGAQPRIEITSYSSTDYNLADYGIKTLVPRQRPVRKSENPEDAPFILNEAAYQSTRGLSSEPKASVNVEGTMRGIQIGAMTIEPVSYDPVNNKIRVFNDIEVTVHFDGADAQATENMLLKTYSPAFEPVYAQLFNNRAITDVYTDHPDLYHTPVKMLVICYSGFKNNSALNSWLQWKLQKGYYVDIYYTDETGTSSSAIASFIKNKYNASVSAGNAYTYLIVIGDTDQVPYYMVKYIDDDIKYCASDLGYSSVNFSSSTSNYFPDMYYSRISVENTTHLSNYINKVLTYEKYEFADGGNYLNNVILVGGWDSNWTSRVAKPTINYATTNYFNSNNTTYGGFENGTIRATISTSSTQGWSGTNHGCYNGLNDGVCLLNYTAHGDKQEWQGPQFTAKQVEGVTNTGKYFFGIGNCCLTGNYNLNDANYSPSYAPSSSIGTTASFGETMIRVPNAGAIAYVGCSPYSYWYEDFYWAVGAHSYSAGNAPSVSNSSTGVYDIMFNDQYWNSASALMYLGNLAVQQAVTNGNQNSGISGSGEGGDCNNSAHYYFQFYHTFGDGSIMPYITKPEVNTVTTPSTISSGTTSITVNALAGSYVAVTNNSSKIYGVAEANSSGVATVNFTENIPNNGTLYVVVTRQQYQPYFGTIEVVGSGEQYDITATVNPTNAGTVEGAGQYYENTQCTLTATANNGYAFDNWTLNNAVVSTDPSYTFSVTGNANYTANFHVLEQHNITYVPQQSHGTISVSPVNAMMGDIVTLTATPDPGFVLDYWDVNTVNRGNVPVENNQFVMPDSEVTVSAVFKVADPLTVADQDGVNETVPFEGYYSDDNYQHSQTIYPSTMLTEMQGMQITKLTYYLRDVATDDLTSTFEIRLGTTTQTEFSSGTVNYISMTGAANYTGTIDVTNSSKEVEIALTTPYTYTSGNLIVDVRLTNHTTGYAHTYFLGESASTYYSVKSKNSSSQPPFSQGSAVTFMPKTTFTYEVPQPYISLSPASATVFTGFTQTLTATYGNATNPTITYASSNTNVATVSGNGTSATVTGISAGTATITATLTYNDNTYTATSNITVEDPSYCTPDPSSVDGKGITQLTFGSNPAVNNSNSSGLPSSSPFYADYTSMVGAAEPGQQVTVNITYTTGSTNSTSTIYSYGTIIWVDWNKNYEFEDSEIVVTGTSPQVTNGTPQQLALTFTVPANQAKGDYRMRIAGADSYFDSYLGGTASANHSPCFSSTYAVCHDYTLRVAGGAYTITCDATTNGTLSVDKTTADENETVTVTATPETDYVLTALTYTPEGGTAQNINIASTPYTFTMPAANVTVNATFSIIRNLPPYNLTLGIPDGYSITLGWTGVSTNTNHQNFEVYHSTNNAAPSDDLATGYDVANTNSYLLSGLTPETTYYAWVRDNCGSDGKSAWVAFNAFTTDETCPAPHNVTASNLTQNSAHISWYGNADSYNVKYATATITGTTLDAVFEDGFENGLDNWTTYINGYVSTVTSPTYNITDWHQQDMSGQSESAHTGSYVAMSRSYDGTDRSVDNWLVSPQLTLGDVVKLWVMDDGTYHEYYEVYVSTGSGIVPSSGTGDFQLVEAPALATDSWSERTVDISAYSGQTGYVAIRHHDAEKDWLMVDDFGVYNTVNTYSYGTFTTLPPTTSISCNITGLSPETFYVAQVQADCGATDGTSGWSSVYFTTPDACSAPTDLVSSNITATTATLGWADNQDSYNVQYRKVYFFEGFEGETLPTGWTTIDTNNDGLTWGVGHATTHSGHNAAYNVSFVYGTDGTTPDDYLVSPQLDLQGTLRVWLSGYARSSSNYSEHFEILLSTTGNSASDFTITLVGETTTTDEYVEYTANLSSYAGHQGYIAIHHLNCTDQYYLYVDDFGLYGSENWVSVTPNPTDATVTLTGLTPMTSYEWQVQGLDCNSVGSSTDWSALANFTTVASYTKQIAAYNLNDNSGWYLIASPLAGETTPTDVTNLISGNAAEFALYRFNQAVNGSEWENYKAHPDFKLVNGRGYLYANSTEGGSTLTFTGVPYDGDGKVTLIKTDNTDAEFAGWNLVGNPFDTDAYVDRNYYVMNAARTDLTQGSGVVPPMEGIFVFAENDGEVLTFSTTAPVTSTGNNGSLNINVMGASSRHGGNGLIDRAIIRFDEGSTITKFMLNENHTKIYIPQYGKDYAVVNAENHGEMPVNFKAEKNGTYTLNISSENVEFSYLHLIDNMTGDDIDVSVNPNYTFEARTSDYASRFKLVFAIGNANDDFAFISNGEIIINGEGIVQIIDMMGRIIRTVDPSQCGNRTTSNGMTPGVYVLRLINGDNINTQKIVVK